MGTLSFEDAWKHIKHDLHHHWEVYGGVEARVLSCVSIKRFEGAWKTDLRHGGLRN